MVMSARTTMAMSALLPKKALMKSSARQRRTAIGATIGGAATTSAILQSWRLGNGGGKYRSVTFTLQIRLFSVPGWGAHALRVLVIAPRDLEVVLLIRSLRSAPCPVNR